jgi:hypothetical protein
MTPRKKVTDSAKPPAKRTRKKATPESSVEASRQPDLLGAIAPAKSPESESESESEMPADPSDNKAGQLVDPALDRPEPLDSSMQHPASSPAPAEPELVPAGDSISPDAVVSGRAQIDAVSQTWLLATNHLNLLHMLAAGMAMGTAGFAGKHYRDPSSGLSGMIPIFRDGVPEAALQQAVSEQKYLRPCIAEIDLTGLGGPVHLISRNGEVYSGALPLDSDSKAGALLVSAPLPMTLVKRLVFRSPADRKEFEASARNFANIDLADLSTEVAERFFSSTPSVVWPLPGQPRDATQVLVDQPPARGEAIGGVLAMLYQLRTEATCLARSIALPAGLALQTIATQSREILCWQNLRLGLNAEARVRKVRCRRGSSGVR